MKLVYVCHAYRDDPAGNTEHVRRICEWLKHACAPMARISCCRAGSTRRRRATWLYAIACGSSRLATRSRRLDGGARIFREIWG